MCYFELIYIPKFIKVKKKKEATTKDSEEN